MPAVEEHDIFIHKELYTYWEDTTSEFFRIPCTVGNLDPGKFHTKIFIGAILYVHMKTGDLYHFMDLISAVSSILLSAKIEPLKNIPLYGVWSLTSKTAQLHASCLLYLFWPELSSLQYILEVVPDDVGFLEEQTHRVG